MTSTVRRLILATACALALPAIAQQAYPNRPVRLVVGNAPGGGTDVAARIVAQKLSTMWGQNVLVDNKPGASGVIGADFVAKAPADGYTLLLSPQTSTAIAANVNRQLPYNVMKDFTSITVVASVPTLIVVGSGMQAKTFAEFAAHAKANPSALSYGSGGNGSTQHLAGEMLNLSLGTKMQHVPYKGENLALTDLVGGQLPFMFMTMSTAMPHIQSGKLRALAIASLSRATTAPQIPTIADSGIPGFEMAPWYGLFGPAGLPRDVTAKIYADVIKVLAMADVKEQFQRQGFELGGMSPDESVTYMRSEISKYERLVKAANITGN